MKKLILVLSIIAILFGTYRVVSSIQPKYEAYLFSYFIGNGEGEEAIFFALSFDGYNYRALNNNQPIISSDEISHTGGVRDPHILRGADGKSYYMVVTDLHVPTDGWTNTGMVMLRSDDLVNWTSSQVNIPELFPNFSDVSRVWAPQTIYDPVEKKYMLYFSMLQPGGGDIIYYAYANEDFTSLETEPRQLFYHPDGTYCIDGDIVFKDGKYHLFFKTEGHGNGIKTAVSDSLTSGYKLIDKYVDQTDRPVEGSGVFKLIGQDKYILMYDMYTSGRYQFTESSDLENFSIIDESISMNFKPRHGTVMPITGKEVKRLMDKWGSPGEMITYTVNAEAAKAINVDVSDDGKSIYIPVVPGTDLSAFDPEISCFPEGYIIPSGAQDFSGGSLTYTVDVKDLGKVEVEVTVSVDNNPVVEGYYADPEIIYSEKEQAYYLYPTSDGFDGWGGYYFETFKSTDLVNWENQGKILDLKESVPWGPRNAWAPTAIERKVNGEYRYFYYFTAAQKIGVATADNPAGPFIDKGSPIVGKKPAGINRGQEIDPDIFKDPQSGKYYLYWGNGYLAVVELNDDMISYKPQSLKIITPNGTFREGCEVFFRKGIYYFMWSEDDTRSPNYRVRYGMSDTPTKIKDIPENNMVIEKDPEQGIYGTGHNSVINVPGTDEWYIVYHRFNRPKGINMGRSAGFHREVCIDKLEFNDDGTIRETTPTLKGIQP